MSPASAVESYTHHTTLKSQHCYTHTYIQLQVYEGSDDIYSPHKEREKERRGMTTTMMTTTKDRNIVTNTYNKPYKKKKKKWRREFARI